ncbi:8-amino-7-oxononanoate synthase [Flavobacterium zepuense]|uniref:8-amino-7-oxononanoate synthase n=1 Tax=Flavobacterium zepuense TaxID=2593302 RepID=A0A552V418_9FLAO|nr:peptidogalycan biosysnthesis protein [Flavobacterium zepuense]TRW25202.1 8-amino-7-oxononanoate synthase [Flavobacterium zepuense]
MEPKLYFKIYTRSETSPAEWDTLAQSNIFLSRNYLSVLEKSAPENMECHFIGLFKNDTLCGIALAQYINLSRVNTFVEEKQSFSLKEYLFKRFTSQTLVIGNNTLTGQNAYLFSDATTEIEGLQLLEQALTALKKQYKRKGIRINLLAIKDFNTAELPNFKAAGFKGYYTFCTQPNMIFTIRENWNSIDDYLADLSTKYRTQYNRARKKADGIEKKKLSETEIHQNRERIYQLYLTVAGNASFNTFHLPENHFEVFKQQLDSDFLFYGYFLDDELIGFNTLIKNGPDMDTYFLGYDATLQKEKMLYLNMLYDMVSYAIKKKFKHIIFARSAMEIKSSVGAVAEEVYGIIKHTNPIINLFTGRLFTYFDPIISWKPRSPFK